MLIYPEIDPVALQLGPLKIHWYGLMYLFGFAGAWLFGRYQAKRIANDWKVDEIGDLLFYGALGVIVGGRLGSVLFYNFSQFLQDPLMLLRIWQGGMSFHGGMLGVFVAMWLYGRNTGRSFFTVTDFIAPLVPLGLFTGRIGNFINGELWGKQSDLPWAISLPCDRFNDYWCGPARHPSQLYEALLEGLLLFVILWLFSRKPRPVMAVSGLFLIGYGVFRFAVEFVRVPDQHLGYLAFDWLTMGQALTLPMLFFGVFFLLLAYRKNNTV